MPSKRAAATSTPKSNKRARIEPTNSPVISAPTSVKRIATPAPKSANKSKAEESDTKKLIDVEAERQAARDWAKTILPPIALKSPSAKATPKEKAPPAPKTTPKSVSKKVEAQIIEAPVVAVPVPIKSPMKKVASKKTPAKSPAAKAEPSPRAEQTSKSVSIPKISTPTPAAKAIAPKNVTIKSFKRLFYSSSELFIRLVAFLTCFYFFITTVYLRAKIGTVKSTIMQSVHLYMWTAILIMLTSYDTYRFIKQKNARIEAKEREKKRK